MKRVSERSEYWAGEFNAVLQSWSTMLSGWLAPIPEAAMTAGAIHQVFGLSNLLSVLVAGSIELVGISVNAHYLDAVAFNDAEEQYRARTVRKTYRVPLEDVKQAGRAVNGFYWTTGAIVALSAIYQAVTERELLKLLAILFPIASAIGTKAMNRRAALHRKRAMLAEQTQERKATMTQTQSKPPAPPVDAPERQNGKGYTATCDHCDWTGTGYATQRGATNALTAHRRYCKAYKAAQTMEGATDD